MDQPGREWLQCKVRTDTNVGKKREKSLFTLLLRTAQSRGWPVVFGCYAVSDAKWLELGGKAPQKGLAGIGTENQERSLGKDKEHPFSLLTLNTLVEIPEISVQLAECRFRRACLPLQQASYSSSQQLESHRK